MATLEIDKLGEPEIVRERGLIREVITRKMFTGWWDSTIDGAPVSLGEAVKRIYHDEDFPVPGARLVDAGGLDIMPNRPIYLIDQSIKLTDSNTGSMELRFEYLGSNLDEWTDVDGSLYQIQTHFDNQDPPQPITVSVTNANGTTAIQGVEVPVLDPRRRAVKTYGRFLNPGETQSSIVGQFLGKVNKTEYLEGEPGTWLVTNMKVATRVEAFAPQRPLVQITVEIEHNPKGHKQYAFWRNPLSNTIGINLVENEGYKRVDWHGEVEFDTEFGP